MKIFEFKTSKNKTMLCGVALFAVVLAGGIGTYSQLHQTKSQKVFTVVAKDFPPGTKISYQVFSKGNFLGSGTQNVGKDGEIQLGLKDGVDIKDKEKLTYKIEVEKASIDKMLDVSNPMQIMLDVDQKQKSVTFSGSGLPEFSNVFVTAGDETKISKTDWAGMFQETGPLKDMALSKANDMVKVAFQNVNLGNDAQKMNPNGTVEVFFGDPHGSSTAKVNERYGRALIMMTEQLSAVMMQQAEIIGTLFDAKIQLETQRKIQELQARAHKDYQPSEQMCRFGTFVRSVAASESKGENDKRVLNRYLMDQYLGVLNSSSALGMGVSGEAKLKQFIKNYCDPYDNNGGLKLLCPGGAAATAAQMERYNKDIDFTRTLDNKLTVDIDFTDNTLTPDEEDILSLAQNLYFPQVFEKPSIDNVFRDARGHYESRTFAAKMNVAHNSFVNIIAMKSSAPVGRNVQNPLPLPPPQMLNPRSGVPPLPGPAPFEDAGWAYMKSMMREFGIVDRNGNGSTDDEIHGLLGDRPSYYAQMEVLTKKIYQNPDFYTNLYDKPANVDRIGVAMDAISIMNQRDRYESLQRREMLTALLVEEGLAPSVEEVNARMFAAMQETQNRTRP